MKPALYPDDGSCGGASDVAVNGEQKVIFDEKTSSLIFSSKSDNSSGSGVSVYLLCEPNGTSSKSFAADEKGSSEAREIWKRLEAATPSQPGTRNSEYVTNKLCHCCKNFKPAGVKFHCRKHIYCSKHFEKRFGFPAVDIQGKVNDINHCPVCILSCTCKKCNERLRSIEQVMKAECRRQSCSPSEVQMDNLFELASMSGETSRSSSKQAEKTSSDTNKASNSTAASSGIISGTQKVVAEEGAIASSSTGTNHLDKRWYENLERLKPYIVNGKMDYSILADEKVKGQLKSFVKRQRRYFRMRQNNEKSPLTNERLQALQAANFPFASQKSTSIEQSQSPPKIDVIVSLKDPSYKQIMEEYFRQLGAKTSQKKNGGLTEREAAEEIYGKLKKRGDRFVRLTSPHNLDGGFIEIDDEEALKKIRSDINRRMESASRWLHPTSSTKNISSTPNHLKRKNADKTNEHASKRPKATDHNEKIQENPTPQEVSRPKSSVHGCPLEYVGNYIANHVQGWEVRQRTNRKLCSDYYVIYRTGCNKKSAVEGKDKFTGYDKLALWAFETGYYKEHVVETEEGRDILQKLGIGSEPNSIFNEAANLGQQSGLAAQPEEPMQQPVRAPESTTAGSESTRYERQDTNVADRQVACPQNSASNLNSNAAAENSQLQIRSPESAGEEQQVNLAGSHDAAYTNNSGAEPQNNVAETKSAEEVECPFAGFTRFSQTAKSLKSSLNFAQERGDELGIKFFSHLNEWIRHKSKDTEFVMQFRSDHIDAAVNQFRDVVGQIEASPDGTDTFKNLANILIDQSRSIFPLS